MCPRCWGKGKIDWVSNITGSKDYVPNLGYVYGVSGYSGVSGISGYSGMSGFSGISGYSGPSPPSIQYGVPIIHPPTIKVPQYSNTPTSNLKPTKRPKLLQKIRDNMINIINELL